MPTLVIIISPTKSERETFHCAKINYKTKPNEMEEQPATNESEVINQNIKVGCNKVFAAIKVATRDEKEDDMPSVSNKKLKSVPASLDGSSCEKKVEIFHKEEDIPFDYTVLHQMRINAQYIREQPSETKEEQKLRIERTITIKNKRQAVDEAKKWVGGGKLKTLQNYFPKSKQQK